MNRNLITTLHMNDLMAYKAFQIEGTVWIVADEGYEDDEGFNKSWWTFGKMIGGYIYQAYDYVPDVNSFSTMAEAVASFNANIRPQVSTDGNTHEQRAA